MKIKKVAPIVIVVVLLLCSIAIIQKNRTTQYEPSIEVAIEQNFALAGQSIPSGNSVSINTYVEKAIISSGAITIFQNYDLSDDIAFSGIKDISIHTKNGKVYNLWKDCKDKSISYDNQTDKAVTYIIFSKTIPLKKIESIEIAGQKFEVNSETNSENV